MRRRRGVALVSIALLLGVTGWVGYAVWWGKPPRIEWFFERAFVRFLIGEPEYLTTLGLPLPGWANWYDDDLTDRSDAHEARRLQLIRAELATLRRYDRSGLPARVRLSADVMDWLLDSWARREPFLYHDYPANQLDGIQAELPQFFARQHPVRSRRDATTYLARLSQVGRAFDQTIEALRAREARGIIAPRFILLRTIEQIDRVLSQAPAESIFYTSFRTRLATVPALSDAERQDLLAATEREVRETVRPAYERLRRALAALASAATEEAGMWRLPNGDAAYREALRAASTTDIAPEDVHALGLARVRELSADLRALLDELGFAGRPVAEAVDALEGDSRNRFDGEDWQADALGAYRRAIEDVGRVAPAYFELLPRARVEVRPIPDEFAAEAASGYEPPAMDGSRPGYFNVRLVREDARVAGVKTLAYHEAIPGHHFQIALQLELEDVPTFRRLPLFGAYTEGWALYAERLADEIGMYADDPLGRFGYVQSELFRAARLVVDTGLHHERWTREQAIEYMREVGLGDQTAEVERYVIWPGQACSYMVGQLRILQLRERARSRLGDRFSLTDFHRVVLQDGALPLSVLERRVDTWLDEVAPTTGRGTQ